MTAIPADAGLPDAVDRAALEIEVQRLRVR